MVQEGAGQQPQEVACRTNARQGSCLSGMAAACVWRLPARVNQPQVDLDQRFVLLLGLMSLPSANHLHNGRAMFGRRTPEVEVRRFRRAFSSFGGLSPRKGDLFAILMCRAVCTECFSIMAFGLMPLQFRRAP